MVTEDDGYCSRRGSSCHVPCRWRDAGTRPRNAVGAGIAAPRHEGSAARRYPLLHALGRRQQRSAGVRYPWSGVLVCASAQGGSGVGRRPQRAVGRCREQTTGLAHRLAIARRCQGMDVGRRAGMLPAVLLYAAIYRLRGRRARMTAVRGRSSNATRTTINPATSSSTITVVMCFPNLSRRAHSSSCGGEPDVSVVGSSRKARPDWASLDRASKPHGVK